MLHAHPKLIHLRKVGEHEGDRVRDGASGTFELGPCIGQLGLGGLRQVVAQEQPAHRMLHPAAHLDEIGEDVFGRGLLGHNVDGADGQQEVEAGENVAGVLDELVQLEHAATTLVLRRDVALHVPQLVRRVDVQRVVRLRAKRRRAELAKHRGGVLERVAEVALVESALHVKCLLLHRLSRLGEPLCLGAPALGVHWRFSGASGRFVVWRWQRKAGSDAVCARASRLLLAFLGRSLPPPWLPCGPLAGGAARWLRW
mmetsp:Transcript_36300/g.95713  ORF Transcript_36300/g.95713 Transcript_36300/m.95713 type:complete len:256 (+) Transcript_36300:384-1151(+)